MGNIISNVSENKKDTSYKFKVLKYCNMYLKFATLIICKYLQTILNTCNMFHNIFNLFETFAFPLCTHCTLKYLCFTGHGMNFVQIWLGHEPLMYELWHVVWLMTDSSVCHIIVVLSYFVPKTIARELHGFIELCSVRHHYIWNHFGTHVDVQGSKLATSWLPRAFKIQMGEPTECIPHSWLAYSRFQFFHESVPKYLIISLKPCKSVNL